MISKLSPDSPTERLWNFNDASGQTYMIKVPTDQPEITATMNWKEAPSAEVILVGKYRFDLPGLEAAGYIRLVGTDQYQLKFLNTDGTIELALNRESKPFSIGQIPRNPGNSIFNKDPIESSNSSTPIQKISLNSSEILSPDATLQEIANALNERSHLYSIGKLQAIRKELKGMGRKAPGPIFSHASVHKDFAFHSGAQGELQFNIGFEDGGFRHGVAFSFETSQSYPDISGLVKKVPLFNEYLLENPRTFEGLQIWEWHEVSGQRSAARPPQPITKESVKHGRFIFIGAITPLGELTVDDVLSDFDRLLSLYLHVESGGSIFGGESEEGEHLEVALSVAEDLVKSATSWKDGFKAGHTPYPEQATASFTERTVEVRLRHNYLQSLIFSALEIEFGAGHVTTELPSASGGEIDFAILKEGIEIFAELKVSSLARWCIRDSIGQLLEYGYLREQNPPSEFWVFGTGACTGDDTAFLEVLRSKLGVPLFYRQFDEEKGALGPKS